MRISDWSSDVCSSDLSGKPGALQLYPPAPVLFNGSDRSPSQKFWIIKHGIKLTAMPAWGKSHDDRLIWDMVAFLQQLPALSSAHYGDTPRRVDPDRPGREPGGAAVAAGPARASHT